MPKGLLEQAMSADVLDQSWRRLKTEHTPWSFEVSRDQLQRHLLQHVIRCRDAVLEGEYRPQPLRQFPMQKPDGGQRILSAQYLQDKFVQRAILIVLEPRAEAIFHSDSYAYRPKRNVQSALVRVRERVKIGQHWLVDADIKKFFDSIPHKLLVADLKRFINDVKAMSLIAKWLKVGAHHSSLLASRRGISQGAILSPLFCNLYLNRFDQSLAKANIPFVRFADDFLLFAHSQEQAIKARDFADKQLQGMGLDLHPEKTQIIMSHPRYQFLGDRLPKAKGN